jgi:hypothetical protein
VVPEYEQNLVIGRHDEKNRPRRSSKEGEEEEEEI